MAFATVTLTCFTDFFIYLKILSADKHAKIRNNKWGKK